MGKNTLLVIGNGFDLDWGFKTSYRNFIDKYYRSRNEYSNGLINEMLNQNNVQGWIDIEEFLRNYALRYNNIDVEVERNIENEFNLLRSDLNAYMCIDKYSSDEVFIGSNTMTKPMSKDLLRYVASLDSYLICSLNYTDLEDLKRELRDPNLDDKNLNVTYIHGRALCNYEGRTPPIILGIDNVNVKDDFACMKKINHPNYNTGLITSLLEANNIIFFGVGFGVTDFPYFRDFFTGIGERNDDIVSIFDINIEDKKRSSFNSVLTNMEIDVYRFWERMQNRLSFYDTSVPDDFKRFKEKQLDWFRCQLK